MIELAELLGEAQSRAQGLTTFPLLHLALIAIALTLMLLGDVTAERLIAFIHLITARECALELLWLSSCLVVDCKIRRQSDLDNDLID